MKDLLEFIFNFGLCYLLAKIAWNFFSISQEVKAQARNEFKQYLNNVVHAVKEEQHGSQIYWFDSDKDTFIAQGKTQKEIVEVLKKNYTNHVFILDNDVIICGPDWIPTENKKITLQMVDKKF
jgi:predicted Zn-dependent protease